MLHDPFSRARIPGDFSRSGRIALLQEAAQALIEGRTPSREAGMFLGSALSAWLSGTGPLERYLQVHTAPGSHATPQQLAASLARMRDDEEDS